jgi:hypothetical protein
VDRVLIGVQVNLLTGTWVANGVYANNDVLLCSIEVCASIKESIATKFFN